MVLHITQTSNLITPVRAITRSKTLPKAASEELRFKNKELAAQDMALSHPEDWWLW